MMKTTLKTVLVIFLKTCKTMSIKPCINRQDKSYRSQFVYTDIVVTRLMKLPEVVTPSYIYHAWSTRKTFWEEKLTPVNIRSYSR